MPLNAARASSSRKTAPRLEGQQLLEGAPGEARPLPEKEERRGVLSASIA